MYTGGGMMIDAPHTGAGVRIEPVFSFGYYAGARRYLSR
jgi:cell wall-associated NlpC family hydrolase